MDAVETILGHRSIRSFTPEKVDEAVVQTIIDCGIRTSTSRGFQHASLIRVTDPQIRAELADIAGQDYLLHAPEAFIAIVDARRSVRIREELGYDIAPAVSADVFREGLTDAILMIQNMTIAAESMGLGVTQLGSVLNDYDRTIAVLGLPRYTFPALGMMFGHPASDPHIKPRIPTQLRVMTDRYEEPESWVEALSDYDETMANYYGSRDSNTREDTYTHMVGTRILPRPSRNRFVAHAIAQGFDMLPDA